MASWVKAEIVSTQQPDASRRAGLNRLYGFLPSSGRHYASNRNMDFGPDDRSNVSLLSGHLRHRLLLESEVLNTVVQRFAPSTAEKFIQEIFWRGYFKGWLEQHPSGWTTYRRDVMRLVADLGRSEDLASRYQKAIDGNTGIACFDAWSRELVETGYLHNHARMWFASIWIFTLQLPWQLGADYFFRHLIDGDPASNTLSWRWVGGLHTVGKTYLAQPDNIERYTAGRMNARGQLATSAQPLTESTKHPRQQLRPVSELAYTDKAALLITEEDARLEDLFIGQKPVAGIALLATAARSPLPVGEVAGGFARAAMEDAATRAGEHFGLSIRDPIDAEDWGLLLCNFATSAGVTAFVTSYAPVGPVSEKLDRARSLLIDRGISLVEEKRAYDELSWRHATRGFFALKKKIPQILEELQRMDAPKLI
ncbi:MAG: FAD-binding domain-containing protein [Hyphomicrobiaceae bacterium]